MVAAMVEIHAFIYGENLYCADVSFHLPFNCYMQSAQPLMPAHMMPVKVKDNF